MQVIAELLGVPEPDWQLLRPWSNAIVKMYEYDVSDRAEGGGRARVRASSSSTCALWSRSDGGRRATT